MTTCDRRERFITTTVSIDEAGLTARPAVWDRKLQRVVHSYRRGEEHLASAMAEKLNAETEGNTMSDQ